MVATKPSISEKLNHDRRSLLDLSNRNSLLNFRRQRTAGVQVVDVACEDVFRRLVIETRKFTFRHDPEAENPENQADLSSEIVSNQPRVTRRLSQSSLQTPYSSTELARRMRRTHSRARTALEETGVNVLFIALGALEWYESDSSEIARRAPLVLVPVTLDQSDVRGDFRIYYSDEDFGTNLSLRERLEQEFGINLPELPSIEDIDVLSYFRDVEKVTSKQTRWRVDDSAIDLNFFSFTRYTMYQDLGSENWPDDDQPADHPVITAILGDGFSTNGELSDTQPVALEELDRKFAPGNPSVIMDADGSQLLAIIEANSGINLVIQGPPGTGKSQTIANILAEAIEQGKNILFVSEKMAALEVVKSRLDAVGLGVACLELHSNKARKTEVLADLKNTFGLGEPVGLEIRPTTQAISTDRKRLNRYCSDVNTPIGNSGVTPVQAYGRTMQVRSKLKNTVIGKLKIKGTSNWDATDRSRKLSIVEELDAHLAEHGAPSDNPLNRSRTSQPPLPGQFQTIDDNYSVFSSSVHALEINSKELAKNLGHLDTDTHRWHSTHAKELAKSLMHPDAISLSKIRNLARLCTLLLEAPDTSGVDPASAVWREQADDLAYLIDIEKHPIGKCKVSPIHAYGQINQIESDFPNISDHALEILDTGTWSEEDRDRKIGIVKELDAYLAEHGAPSDNPLNRSRTSQPPLPGQFQTIDDSYSVFSSSVRALEINSKELAKNLARPDAISLSEIRNLARLCTLLLEAPDTSGVDPASGVWHEHGDDLAYVIDIEKRPIGKSKVTPVHAYGQINQIESDFPNISDHALEVADASTWSEEDRDRKIGIVKELDAYLAEHGAPSKNPLCRSGISIPPRPSQFRRINATWQKFSSSMDVLTNNAKQLSGNLELPEPNTISKVGRLIDLCHILLDVPDTSGLSPSSHAWTEHAGSISNLIDRGKSLTASVSNKSMLWNYRDFELNELREIESHYTGHGGKWYSFLFQDYRNAKKRVAEIFEMPSKFEYEDAVTQLGDVISFKEIYDDVASQESVLQDIILDYSSPLEVDWDALDSLDKYLRWARSPQNAGRLVISTERLETVKKSESVLKEIEASLKELKDSYNDILSGLELDHHDDLAFTNRASDTLNGLRGMVSSWCEDLRRNWTSIANYNGLKTLLDDEGLGDVAEYAWNYDLSRGSLSLLVEYRFYEDLLEHGFNLTERLKFDRVAASIHSVLPDVIDGYSGYSDLMGVDWGKMEDIANYLQRMRSPSNAGNLVISAELLANAVNSKPTLETIESSLKSLEESYGNILSGFELDHHDDLAFTNRASDTLNGLRGMVSSWCEDLRRNWTSIANYNGLKTLLDDEGLGDVAEYAWNYDLSRGSLSLLVEYRFYEDLLEHGFNLTERLKFDRVAASIHSVLPDVIDGYSGYSDLMGVDWGKMEDIANYLQRMRSPSNAGNLVISAELLANAVNSKPTLETIESSLKSLEESYINILSGFELDHHADLKFSNNTSVSLVKLHDTVSNWHKGGLQTWRSIATFNQISSQLKRERLDSVVECAWNWDSSEASLLLLAEYHIYDDLVDTALKQRLSLRGFDRSVHEHAITRFRKNDPMLMDMTKSEVSRRHWNGIPRSVTGGEMAFLQNEMAKKRRILPIRRLLEHAGRAVQAIKPIFMMSPLSVATYLTPGNIEFDMVVFDEASQVKPVDAFGAILRGNSAVVVGDSRQLPPTSFFDRVSEETDEDDFDQHTSDLESVLDVFVARGAREKTLQWHYRSQHESLIAVSNKEFYQDQLLVAPSPDSSMTDLGVQFRHLPHTHYTKGGRNAGEALEVAKAVMDHARNYPHLSLGVAAFSKSQADVIEDEVDRLIREDKSINVDFFSRHPEEPFFVKNLENVQGDERDVIFISVGYGKQADGVLRMNFGPLNTQGGERRMNVLITRAKRRCVVFSNITSGDIDLSRTNARGVQALKTYLEFAETGRMESPKATGMSADSPFEEWVARELRARGYRVDEQVGTGQYRIDLAVVDDKRPGHYLLGIECDGASYHSSKTARDRDRIRQDTLESKGWKIHRIWSTDWFYSPKEEMDRLVRAIEETKSEHDLDVKRSNMRVESASNTVSTALIERKETSNENSSGLSNVPYVAWEPKRRRRRISAGHKNWDTIRRQILEIVNVEGPVHVSEVRSRISNETGPSLTARDDITIRSYAEKSRKISVKGDFLYKASSRVRFVRDRSELPSQSKNIDLIAPEELQLAIRQVVKESIGIHVDELARAICSMLGLGSTTEKRRKAILKHLDLMKRRRRVVERNGVLELVSR